ncbi:O-antigen ligase family protein, partial [Enterococcus faecalis]
PQRNFSVHTAYLNTLASTRILGAVTFVLFLLGKVVRVIKYLFNPITNFLPTTIFYCICGVLPLPFSGFFHNEMILVD